ncbi:hypothetical protein [Thalassotalea sp. Y01]|uniref:hypothetical protein n=1 Tax=Thalassotalea sp. Y01 TaxID=2729613 RepID=UPI00145C86CA|nr:hypothetical protein [Thalassotalea sp. Y01]NMP17386.1 hypothetical protein [Thalassotalea sp. Y01]
MTLTAKQFSHLSHMGIAVWQRRQGAFAEPSQAETVAQQPAQLLEQAPKQQAETPNDALTTVESKHDAATQTAKTAHIAQAAQQPQQPEKAEPAINLQMLLANRLLTDVLHVLQVQTQDITLQQDGLQLQKLTWKFAENADVSYQQNTLITCDINNLESSATLKRKLWQALCQHISGHN